jgi:hypothetical protein
MRTATAKDILYVRLGHRVEWNEQEWNGLSKLNIH